MDIKTILKNLFARVSVRVDNCGRKVLFVEEIKIRKKKKW